MCLLTSDTSGRPSKKHRYTAFSELLPLLEVGTTPLLKVDKICQQISTTILTIDSSITFSTPFATFTSTASANFEVRSPSRIQVMEMSQETAEEGEEIRSILKVIAATGKFCHDWEKLRSMLSLHLKQLLPLMVAAISVPGPDKVPPHLKTHFTELKGAQVKTVSFLTYLFKSFADYIRPHEESICKSILNLLVTCSDSVSIRKELLIALKHVLGTDFKRGLFPLIDTLLEERVLVGIGRACFETLRPLAYSLLEEIVHHVCGDLSLSQLSRIIYLFSSNMHVASLSLKIHTTCARLLLNLGRILDAFLLEDGYEGKDRSTLKSKLELPVQAVLNIQVPLEHSKEVSDCKHLIKTLVMGIKAIIWSITHAHLPRSQGYWMVKRVVGSRACLLGKVVTCNYLRQDNFLEG
ncbi:unnamed protein product [Lactuca virosa]|uniref:Plastid lipid-associated protein/fibrillin conserved domain-containing protein n=1 Tax=Lactuca virosa TaxID=75947 RepID=A0AAU9PHN0_9ASTR|nr:unnamed protein product [Lactuca virosa]